MFRGDKFLLKIYVDIIVLLVYNKLNGFSIFMKSLLKLKYFFLFKLIIVFILRIRIYLGYMFKGICKYYYLIFISNIF